MLCAWDWNLYLVCSFILLGIWYYSIGQKNCSLIYFLCTQQVGGTGNTTNYVQPTVGATTQPAMVTPTPANPPTYTPSAQQQVSSAEFQVNFDTPFSCGVVDFLYIVVGERQYYLSILLISILLSLFCAWYCIRSFFSDWIHDLKPIRYCQARCLYLQVLCTATSKSAQMLLTEIVFLSQAHWCFYIHYS